MKQETHVKSTCVIQRRGTPSHGTSWGLDITSNVLLTTYSESPPFDDGACSVEQPAQGYTSYLIGCGLLHPELVGLGLEDFQIREQP